MGIWITHKIGPTASISFETHGFGRVQLEILSHVLDSYAIILLMEFPLLASLICGGNSASLFAEGTPDNFQIVQVVHGRLWFKWDNNHVPGMFHLKKSRMKWKMVVTYKFAGLIVVVMVMGWIHDGVWFIQGESSEQHTTKEEEREGKKHKTE